MKKLILAIVLMFALCGFAQQPGWRVTNFTNEMTDAKGVGFALFATKPIPNTVGTLMVPSLSVICSEGKVKGVLIDTGTVLGMPDNYSAFYKTPQSLVRLRFDSSLEVAFFDQMADQHTFSLNKKLLKKIVKANIFKVQFSDASGEAQVMEFAPAGFPTEQFEQSCGQM